MNDISNILTQQATVECDTSQRRDLVPEGGRDLYKSFPLAGY